MDIDHQLSKIQKFTESIDILKQSNDKHFKETIMECLDAHSSKNDKIRKSFKKIEIDIAALHQRLQSVMNLKEVNDNEFKESITEC